jgi:hypothetical protein
MFLQKANVSEKNAKNGIFGAAKGEKQRQEPKKAFVRSFFQDGALSKQNRRFYVVAKMRINFKKSRLMPWNASFGRVWFFSRFLHLSLPLWEKNFFALGSQRFHQAGARNASCFGIEAIKKLFLAGTAKKSDLFWRRRMAFAR